MEEKQSSDKRFALLIDADNVSSKYIKPIMDELSKYGTVTYKRIYGDWTLTLHAKWKDALLENSITPIQQFGYTQGKNATDSAMIIDAMDILYTRSVEGFCIVSSDSDFTRLAARIRESGLTVIGMGEKKTPVPFRKACDIFTTLELLVDARKDKDGNTRGSGQAAPKDAIEQAVVDIITDNQNNGKSTGLGEVGSRLLKRYPDFDVRSYGTNLLSKLLDEFTRVQITKDGSNVSVELAEDKDHGRRKEQPAQRSHRAKEPAKGNEDGGAKDGKAAERAEGSADEGSAAQEAGDQAGKDAAAVEGTSEGAVASAPRARRSRRSRRSKSALSGTAQEANPAEGTADAVRAEGAGSDAAAHETAGTEAAPAAAPSTDNAPKQAKPRAKRTAAAKKQQEAPAQQAAEQAPGQGQKKAAPAAKARTAENPEAYIRQQVREGGAAGVNLNELGKRVRAKFRTFKLRDLGYTQFRQYVADLDDIMVEKQGSDYTAHLGE